jgi:RHS repeat-associated protein
VYDQEGHLLGEYNASGVVQEFVWLGDLPVAVIVGSVASPLPLLAYADHLNAPRVLIDKTDAARWRWISEPFGTTQPEQAPAGLSPITFNLRFPGQYYDSESGLNYNYFRDYDGTTGRYAQSDPIGLEGGINTYAYVGGNPLSFVDPNGLQASGGGGGGGGSGPCLDFDFDKFANQIEQNRSSTATDLAALGSAFAVGTMPKTPSELRGFGLSKEQMNPWTSQLSRWSSRLGTRELREIGRTVAGKAVSATATAALVVDGFYNWYVIGKAAIDATSSCGCKQ